MEHKIGWLNRPGTTGETYNPVTGCTKISPGCKNCYAERMSKRLRGRFGYPQDDPFAVTLHEDKLNLPLKWQKPRTVFVCSMGDLFHEDVPFKYIDRIWRRMDATPQHTYMVLTKRPARLLEYWAYRAERSRADSLAFSNVILGVTVENQDHEDRIPLLLQCPAAKRFVSYEPALGAVDFRPWMPCVTCGNSGKVGYSSDTAEDCPDCKGMSVYQAMEGAFLDYVIAGAETGPGARPADPAWFRSVRDQCAGAGVPFFMKAVSGKGPVPDDLMIREWPGGAE